MELNLEGILETVLVGTVASLFLLSALFLLFGHVLRVDPIRRIAKLVLYETEVERREEHATPAADGQGGRQASERTRRAGEQSERTEEKHLTFAFLLMIAVLYGLGATVEAMTHDISLYNDKSIKTTAFEKVARGRVQGRAASGDFARFVIDHAACKAAGISEQPQLDARGVSQQPPVDSPCLDIYRQEQEFYYTAKNAVYVHEAFVHELSPLQARIDFLRSACISLLALAAATLLAFLVAAGVELLYRHKTPVSRFPSHEKTLVEHWKDLAAVRCLLISILMLGFSAAAYYAWQKCEIQFNRRVFGYYLSMVDGAEEEGLGEHGKPFATRPSLPSSPFRVFSLDEDHDEFPSARHGGDEHRHNPLLGWMGQFEPSGVQTLDRFDHLIVVNDKGGTSPFILFDLDHVAGLHNPRTLTPQDSTGWRFRTTPKIEAIHAYGRDGGRRIMAIATVKEADGTRWMADFSVDYARAIATDVQVDTVSDPCSVVAQDGNCSVEGMAVVPADRPEDQKLLLGIRRVGKNPIVAIVQLSYSAAHAWNHPEVLYRADDSFSDGCRGLSGVSDLQVLDQNGPVREVLILTSVELRDEGSCSDPSARAPAPVAQVRGAIWHLSLNDRRAQPRPTMFFVHKPEGMAVLNDGTVLVVFDDDGDRKSTHRGLETFPLEQYESVFAIVPVH